MIPHLEMSGGSFITNAILSRSQENIRSNEPLTLSLSFKIEGEIKKVFNQKNWERAYNKHDNGFRMNIKIEIKSGRKTITQSNFVRKAVLFWTRNPKIPYRIWISIVKDDAPVYPLTIEEAESMLFDVNKVIELSGSDLELGTNKLHAKINVRWGKHEYIDPLEINGNSNEIELIRTDNHRI